jgi:hypothetical protein
MSIGLKEQLVSLQKATELCPHSQEYLSLRARQGKLRAVKIGRNWFTTNEWVQAYLEKSGNYKKEMEARRSSGALQEHMEDIAGRVMITRWPEPPANLPVEENSIAAPVLKIPPIHPARDFSELMKLASVFAAVIVLLGLTSMLHKDTFEEVSYIVYPAVQHATSSISIPKFDTNRTVALGASFRDIGSVYILWFGRNVSKLGEEIADGIYAAHRIIARAARSFGEQTGDRFTRSDVSIAQRGLPTSQHIAVPENPKKGLVVIPSSDSNEQVKKRVQQSFSDEVAVVPRDEESGIITPVFRDTKGEDYFYILVPLQEAD